MHVTDVTLRSPSEEEQHALRRLGDGVVIATLSGAGDVTLDVAAAADKSAALVGPFVTAALTSSAADAPESRVADHSPERS